MPKLLEDVEKRLIEATRAELLEKGLDGLGIRDIAKKCRISVGTVYNYFPSKEMLAASVMVSDWNIIISKVEQKCAEAQAAEDGLTGIYNGLKEFAEIYSHVRGQYSQQHTAIQSYFGRHQRLVGQLSQIIEKMLTRLGYIRTAFPAKFIAEIIIVAAVDTQYGFQEYMNLIGITLEKLKT